MSEPIDNVIQALKKTQLGKLIEQVSKNGDGVLGIVMCTAPLNEQAGEKKTRQKSKEFRKELQSFFKEQKQCISLEKNHFILSLPEQWVEVINQCCRANGYRNNTSRTGAEYFSLIGIYIAPWQECEQNFLKMFRLIWVTQWSQLIDVCCLAITLKHYTITTIEPMFNYKAPVDREAKNFRDFDFSIMDLHSFAALHKSVLALDTNIRQKVGNGLFYLEKFHSETDYHIKLTILYLFLDLFLFIPPEHSRLYLITLCCEISEKINFSADNNRLFADFYDFKSQSANEPLKENALEPIIARLTVFCQLLIIKIIKDPQFFKQTLPENRSNIKKYIKKAHAKNKFRNSLLGRFLARLIRS